MKKSMSAAMQQQEEARNRHHAAPLPVGERSPAGADDPAEAAIDERAEIVRALGVLLGGYIELLDGHDHGGWTREEENLVRAVRSLLVRAGRNGAPPGALAASASQSYGEERTGMFLNSAVLARMHGGITHFPIALVLAAVGFDLAGHLLRREPRSGELHAAGFYALLRKCSSCSFWAMVSVE
jgi:hypothetical protein